VKLELPGAALTVPLIVPDELSVSPLGNDPPTIDQLYGVVPPVADRVCPYAPVVVAPGKEEVVMFGAAFTVRVNDWEALKPTASVTLTVNV
jgi:hypothetical protein